MANACTTASLMAGLAGLFVTVWPGSVVPAPRLWLAAGLIIAGTLLDAADGPLARRHGTCGEFGAHLDNLADVVTSGVAPAVVVLCAQLHSVPVLGVLLPAAYVVAAMWRLARFAVLKHLLPDWFIGVPVPAAACLLMLIAAIGSEPDITLIACAALSAAMVSGIRVPTWSRVFAAGHRQPAPEQVSAAAAPPERT
jgi:CDP-diacylglycerol--serine O-phosphatidyltransferase